MSEKAIRELNSALAEGKIDRATMDAEVVRLMVADFDRRRAKPWGRFLLWLLRKTT